MHKDKLGQVIYVGKAISLRNRVRQYFQSYGKSTAKLRALTSNIAEFDYITCATEMEALILECNLIKNTCLSTMSFFEMIRRIHTLS